MFQLSEDERDDLIVDRNFNLGREYERAVLADLLRERQYHDIAWTTTHGDDLTDSGCKRTCRACRIILKAGS